MANKPKKQKKDPNNLQIQREGLREELITNAYDMQVLVNHQPWVVVSVFTFYLNEDGEEQHLQLVGPAKICWPDRWDEGKGLDTAVGRAVAWAVKLIIPPHNVITPRHKEELDKLLV